MNLDPFQHDRKNKLSPLTSTQPHDSLLRLQRDKYRQEVAELRTQLVKLQAQVDESECTIGDLRRLLAEAHNDAVIDLTAEKPITDSESKREKPRHKRKNHTVEEIQIVKPEDSKPSPSSIKSNSIPIIHSKVTVVMDESSALPSAVSSPEIRIQSVKEIPSHKRSFDPENDLAVASPNTGGNEKRRKLEQMNPRASTSAHLPETASPVSSSLNTRPELDAVATTGSQFGEVQPTPPIDNILHQDDDPHLKIKIKDEAFTLPLSIISSYLKDCAPLAISSPETSSVPRRLISLAYGGNGQQLLQYIRAPLNPSGPKKRRMVFPMLNMNPAMPTRPGEPGLLFASRHEILYNAPWSLFCRSMVGKEPRWRYLGEFNSVLCGKMTTEQFRAQKQAVKDNWGKLILKSLRYDVYVSMLARIALRKYGLVDEPNENALEIAEMAAIRSKTGRHVTVQDITGAFSCGDEAIDILRMECVSYDHVFAADIATRLRGYDKLLAGAQTASRGKGGRGGQKPNKAARERSFSVSKMRGDLMLLSSDSELTDYDYDSED